MHRREPEQIGELFLRYRKVAFDQARGADRKAIMNFADQVGEPRERVAPPDVEQPFAADRRLDQYVDDDRAREGRARHDEPQLGRATWRESRGQDVECTGVARVIKKKKEQ